MRLKSSLAAVLVLAGLAAPALADPYPGYQANVLPATPETAPYPFVQQQRHIAVDPAGTSAFAFVPAPGSTGAETSGAGGGSFGYNAAEQDAVTNR